MKKVAFISYTFSFGGIQKSMLMIAQLLQSRGFQSYFISTYLDDFQSCFHQYGTCVFLPDSQQLIKFLRENRIDIVQLNLSDYGGYCAYLAGVRGIVERVDGMKSAFMIDKKPIDCIISSTSPVFERSKELYPEKYNVRIVNGVDLDRFIPADRNPDLREKLGIAIDDLVIGYAGRMSHEKCLDKLINVFSGLVAIIPNIKLTILGSTTRPEEQMCKQSLIEQIANLNLNNYVFLLPQTESPEKIISIFDIGVHTAGTYTKTDGTTGVMVEGYSNALLEQCAMEIPIVTTNTGDVSGVVKDGYNGYVIGLDDMQAFREKLLHVIQDAELREKMGKNGRKFIAEHFSFEQMATNYENLYRYVVSDDFVREYPDSRKDMKNHYFGNPIEISRVEEPAKILVFRSGSVKFFDFIINEIDEKFAHPEIAILCHKNNEIDPSQYKNITKIYYYDKSALFEADKMQDLLAEINGGDFQYLFFIYNDFLARASENISGVVAQIKASQKIVVSSICDEMKTFIYPQN